MAEDFLRRWSRLKHEQAAAKPAENTSTALPEIAQQPAPLPPVDTLKPESDFSGFMQPKVEDKLRRAALKKLFGDPHFNVPDPFEPFSGDWTGGGAITPEMLAGLNQAKQLFASDEKKEKPDELAQTAQATPTAPAAPTRAPAEAPEEDEPRRQDA